ncbi:alkaline phosphatase family protein [Cellulomonas soli]|uniref:alkaline phosphatase family protein n=1 Tax=Cellulomonas soli TaxID=931535 RepID=UPI003F87E661
MNPQGPEPPAAHVPAAGSAPDADGHAVVRPRTWRPTLQDVGDAGVGLLTTAVGLGVAIAVVDGASAQQPWSVLLAAVVVGVGDALLRPALRVLASVAGAVGALVAGLAGQVVLTWVALSVVPGLHVADTWSVVEVLVVTGAVMAAGRWLWGANDSEYVIADVLRRARAHARRAGTLPDDPPLGDGRPPGLLVVQLDGVGAPVLAGAMEAGLAPTMQRWVSSGEYVWSPWWARVPSTTPASQAGLLHGDSSVVPAFRWWDRGLGRLVVTNHPADAALVERRVADGQGLLAGGGTAISTMFSGDAARAYLVMSRTRTRGSRGERAGFGPGPSFVRFFAGPFVLTRAVGLSVGEMVKELYQARRQRVRDVRPRISRGGWFVVLRGVTNVLLRDLNTSLVAEALVRGDPTVFVDLVDYDEIAHHAGPTRPESLRALEGVDRVLGILEKVVEVAPRAYRVVVLSDHGQALGATFEQVEGRSLLDVVRTLMAEPHAPGLQSADGEQWGPFNAFLSALTSRPGVGRGHDERGRRGVADTPAEGAGAPTVGGAGAGPALEQLPEVVVAASGNLGLVWFPRSDRPLALEDLHERWPGLVGGLVALDAVGVVVVDTRTRGLVAVGSQGVVHLEDDEVPAQGQDPLAPYGPRARADLARAARLAHTGDLLVVSAVSGPVGARHVHAFEGQIGSHGGLGGDQNEAFVLHPADWELDADLLERVGERTMMVGAEQVHRQLVRWLRKAGIRT